MEDLSIIQKHDIVLSILCNINDKSPTIERIEGAIQKSGNKIFGEDLLDILQTLIKDEYVYLFKNNQTGEELYLPNFNGKLLNETGGLQEKIRREKNKELLSNEQLTQSISVSKWTKWNIGMALTMSGTTLFVLIFTCNRDTNRYRKESDKQSPNTQQPVETIKSSKEPAQFPQKIFFYPLDTSKKK